MMLGWSLVLACTLTACLGQERRAMGFMGVRGKKDGGGDPGSGDRDVNYLDGNDLSAMADPHPPYLILDPSIAVMSSSFLNKRAPSFMGFQGVRGKKDELLSPSSGAILDALNGSDDWKRAPMMGFQGVRGKKAPMGFTGVRGKKDDWIEEDKRAPASGFFGVRGKKGPSGSSFFGMRGKKGPSSSGFFGMRGKKGPSGFMGVRGKKEQPEDMESLLQALKDSPMRQDFNNQMELRAKRLAPTGDFQLSSKSDEMQ